MSRQLLHRPIDMKESKKSFQKRNGKLMPNHRFEKQLTTNSARFVDKYREKGGKRYLNGTPVGIGRVTRVGNDNIRPDDTAKYVQGLIDNLPDNGLIVERYATHYCHGTSSKGNGATCFFNTFVQNHQKAEETCTVCGTVTKLVTYLSTNSMNSEGKVDRNARNHAPAGVTLGSNTSGPPQGNVPIPAHRQRFRRMDKIIQNLSGNFLGESMVIPKIETRARHILRMFYENKHGISDVPDDNVIKMPPGEAATAAACFLAAKLDHESRCEQTPVTMLRIVEYANHNVKPNMKGGKNVARRVRVSTLLDYCHLFAKDNLIQGSIIPPKDSLVVLWNNDHTEKYCARMGLFQKCGPPITVRLAKTSSNGVKLEETESGCLRVKSLNIPSQAHTNGLRAGDFLMTLERKEIPVDTTVTAFLELFTEAMSSQSQNYELCVRRLTNSKRKHNAEQSRNPKKRKIG